LLSDRREAPLLELVRDAIIVREFGGAIRFWNGGAAALYGWGADDALGSLPEILLRTCFPQPDEEVAAATARSGYWEGELVQTARDGTILTVASRWHLRRDERGVAIVQIDTDITARKRLETGRAVLLAAQEAEVTRLGELAALKADFTAMVAHELSGPLGAIGMLAEMLSVDGIDSATRDRALATIRSEVALMQALTRDVSQAARIERGDFAVHPAPVPLASILVQAADFAATLPGDHPLAVTDAATLGGPVVLADASRIGQVLRNLLGNAARYSAPGTPITLRAEFAPGGQRVRIAVADQGDGIHPDDLARIFDKYGRGRDRAGRRVSGAGLGLYLSRRIAQDHGDDLIVESAVGTGSTFTFTLEVPQP